MQILYGCPVARHPLAITVAVISPRIRMSMKTETPSPSVFQRKISEFCRLRVEPLVSSHAAKNLKGYMMGLIIFRKTPPTMRGRIDWSEIASECDIEDELTRELKKSLQPGLEAIDRWLKEREAAKLSRAAAEKKAAAAAAAAIAKPVPRALRPAVNVMEQRHLLRPRRVA